MDRLEQKLDRMEERVDAIDVSLGRVDERLIRLHDLLSGQVSHLQVTLDAHGAKASKAYVKAEEAEKLALEAKAPLEYLQKTAAAAKWLSWLGGGIIVIYNLIDWLRS